LKLSKLATIAAGHPFRGRIPEKSGSGILAIQMKDVSVEEGIFWPSVIETELTGKKQPDWLRRGDILFAARGLHNYAVLMDEDKPHVVASPHFYILRVKDAALLPEFLAWQLNQKPLQKYFERSAEGTLTKSVRRLVLADAPMTVPPLERQQQILCLHETIMHEKALYSELIRNGERVMNSIASQLVTGKTV
jgi:restriction endonuclease S subunit